MTDAPAVPDKPTLHLAQDALPIPQLVGAVYQTATPADRGRLIEALVRPLGLLCLAAVSSGVFTAIRLRSGWDTLQVRLEDTLNIRAPDVAALADMVQQVDADLLDSLRSVLASPSLAGTAAAALLLAMLARRTAARRDNPTRD